MATTIHETPLFVSSILGAPQAGDLRLGLPCCPARTTAYERCMLVDTGRVQRQNRTTKVQERVRTRHERSKLRGKRGMYCCLRRFLELSGGLWGSQGCWRGWDLYRRVFDQIFFVERHGHGVGEKRAQQLCARLARTCYFCEVCGVLKRGDWSGWGCSIGKYALRYLPVFNIHGGGRTEKLLHILCEGVSKWLDRPFTPRF